MVPSHVAALCTVLLAPSGPVEAPAERVEAAPPPTDPDDLTPAPAPLEADVDTATTPGVDGAGDTEDADGPAAQRRRPPSWQAELVLDLAYGWSNNLPDNHVYRFMYTAPRTHELAVHNVGGFITHAASERQPWSLEVGLHVGASVDALTDAEPIPGGPDGKYAGSEVFKYIARANAGFVIPKAKTHISAGVFESPMGIGSFWTFHNWNYTTTVESNVVPYYLTGLRIVQPLPGNLELAGWLVNGFQTYADLNAVPSGLVTLTWARPPRPAPSPRQGQTALTLSTQAYFGPESRDLGARDWLVYWDTWAVWDFDDHFAMAAVWDLGVDRAGRQARTALQQDQRQLYTGGALFARGTVVEREHLRMDLSLRPEASLDRDGRFTGASHWWLAGTATASLWMYEHLLLRAEYRYDHSTAPNGYFYVREFGSDDSPFLAGDQHTVFVALTAWWDFWF